MALGITFANVPLLLEDPQGKIQHWLDSYLPTDDLRIVTEWQYSPWRTWDAPSPNHAHPLAPKLNTWYRPVGACRWAFGLFLASTDQKNAILNQVGSGNPERVLRFEYPEGVGRSWRARLLCPRPVSASVTDPHGLWILPIVDERYYWQYIGLGGVSITDGATWESVMQSCATALGITLNIDTIPAAYGSPDTVSFNAGRNANAAQVLDACAWSVGHRIILEYMAAPGGPDSYYPGVYRSCSWSTSTSRRTYNLSIPNAGGALQSGTLTPASLNFAAANPAAIRVVFQKWANGIPLDEYYSKTCNAADYTSNGSTSGVTLTIQTSAYANYTAGGGVPDNQTACDNLAAQIATDFYQQTAWLQDSVYPGVWRGIETGWDNYVEFSIGRRRPDGTYECRTRVHSAPHNLGVQSMLHWLSGTHDYPETIEGKLDGALTAGGTATMSVWEDTAGTLGDSGRNLTITDRLQWDAPAGAWAVCKQIGREWRPIAISCNPV